MPYEKIVTNSVKKKKRKISVKYCYQRLEIMHYIEAFSFVVQYSGAQSKFSVVMDLEY